MNNEKASITRSFAILLGYIKFISEIKKLQDFKNDYIEILNEISLWSDAIINRQLELIDNNKIKEIYKKIDVLREKIMFDSKYGIECKLSDEVLIWFEIVMNYIKEGK